MGTTRAVPDVERRRVRHRPRRSAVLVAAAVVGMLTAACTATDDADPGAADEGPTPGASASDEPTPEPTPGASASEEPTPEASPSEEPRPRGAASESETTTTAGEGDHGAVLDALTAGGQVVYIRHAATEKVTEGPDLDLDDPDTQRNLSAEGRQQADEIGQAFTRLDVPVGAVVSSPYWRARETAEIAFGEQEVTVDDDLLYDEHPDADRSALAEALRGMLAEAPAGGTNTVIVGHGGNLQGATRVLIDEGATAVFTPRSDDEAELVGIVPADDWEGLG